MDLIFNYSQEKKDRKTEAKSTCDLKLYYNESHVNYIGTFDFNYSRYGSKKNITFVHSLLIDLKTSDISITYEINNNGLTEDSMFKTSIKTKKNDFKMLHELTENGFIKGEKRYHYWGVKYARAIMTLEDYFSEILTPKIKLQYNIDSLDKSNINKLYNLILYYHLDVKEIKGHDNIHLDIQNNYPRKVFLKKNDNKYIPSILDGYGIKSKYLVSELSKCENHINLNSLNYLCKLFGDNYIDYIKKINWKICCEETTLNKKIHTLKNDSEKSFIVKVINDWNTDSIRIDNFIDQVNKLLTMRELLKQKGVDLKFNAKTSNEFDLLFETWMGIKLHLSRGFKVKYIFDDEFIKSIEEDIIIENELYKPRILLSEDDFRIEGYMMKNCLSKQFIHASLYIYVSLIHNRKRINLQYRKGSMVQTFGKANTVTPETYSPAIEILTKRFELYPEIVWKKEKYDFLSR